MFLSILRFCFSSCLASWILYCSYNHLEPYPVTPRVTINTTIRTTMLIWRIFFLLFCRLICTVFKYCWCSFSLCALILWASCHMSMHPLIRQMSLICVSVFLIFLRWILRSIASLGVRGRFNLVFFSHLSNFAEVSLNLPRSLAASWALALVSLY